MHYSTDHVFNGAKADPYTEADSPLPFNHYGETKLVGEIAINAAGGTHFILRTSWVYGLRGHNFLRTILRLARERKVLRVVSDQMGAPTWSRVIVQATGQLLEQVFAPAPQHSLDEVAGVYHLCASGKASWYEFAEAILALAPPSMEAW